MPNGIVWCPHCERPHKLVDTHCATTGLPLERRVHVSEKRKNNRPVHPFVGTTLNSKYIVHRRLGSGGMGEVFEAEDRQLGKRVAIKVVSNTHDEASARLM